MNGNPTLYLAHATENSSCNCSSVEFNSTDFPADGTLRIPDPEQHSIDFSMAVSFTRILEFNTSDSEAAKSLNLSLACNSETLEPSFSEFIFNDSTSWTFSPENSTFIGTWHNESDVNHTKYEDMIRFSIRVSGFLP
jgi:hypothetical protein